MIGSKIEVSTPLIEKLNNQKGIFIGMDRLGNS